ncbi:IS607 family element RNA-guided endonuclease TnpB [Streptomonospora litoralis]|uniref:Putative transposase n=1 Tax=Streptomonospora litoralis TaxID=2498135 RepID=A0A4P6Q0Q7_9ACTN|nr:IS607 family element RNA-guided endonuclease TnpB [Streptomonospora litoralis]QBI54075.1 putative transposase [Streptomonospora litoralis]
MNGAHHQAYLFALDAAPEQEQALSSHAGAARFAYNWGLARVKANLTRRAAERTYGLDEADLTPGLNWSAYSLRKDWNTAKHEAAPWWGENSKEAYSCGLANLAQALKNWSASRAGKRTGKKTGFPKFKSKRSRKSFRITTGAFGLAPGDNRHVKLPRIGVVRTHESTRKLARHLARGSARILAATVSFQRGRWHVSFTVEKRTPAPAPATGGAVGVDLGVKHLAVLSTGEAVDNPEHLDRAQRKMRRAQRRAARRTGPDRRTGQTPSNRWRKARAAADRLHTKTANARRDGLHKLTTRLTNAFSTIVIEDLNVAGMAANRSLARAVSDTGMGELRRQLEYETAWSGRHLVVADRWFPSSKTCNDCGAVKAKLRLSERTFTCEACGMVADRDANAAADLADLAEVAEVAEVASSPGCGARINEPLETHVSPPLVAMGTATGRPRPVGRGQRSAARRRLRTRFHTFPERHR